MNKPSKIASLSIAINIIISLTVLACEAKPEKELTDSTSNTSEVVTDAKNQPIAQKDPAVKVAPKKVTKASGHPFSWPFIGWEKMSPRGGTTKGSTTKLSTEANPAVAMIHADGITNIERDRRAILALAGDYRVSFDFIETASNAFPYTPPRPYFSWATERVFVIENRPEFISIQHILVMEFVDENGESQGFTMKHWRQDWSFQDEHFFNYVGDATWKTYSNLNKTLTDKGFWSQAVFQVDDSPRYEVLGRWDHTGGFSVFRSEDFWRPLPRREFAVRSDYNVLGGRHEIAITPSGWLHTQINRKLVIEAGAVRNLIAQELGAVRYERITSPSLEAADTYWQASQPFWAAVRSKWQEVLANQKRIKLKAKVDGQPMYAKLFGLAGELENKDLSDDERKKVIGKASLVIDSYISHEGDK
jgi:hypothetical protein